MTTIHDPEFSIRPLTPNSWNDLETLFGPKGACGGCWCMYWRLTRSQFNSGLGDQNHQAFKAIVLTGKPVGLLAYDKGEPVGWMATAPREDYPTLDRSRILKRFDHKKVWSISCFYVAPRNRGKGVMNALVEGSKEFIRKNHGKIIEAYPIIPRISKVAAGSAYTGILSVFEKAGFHEVCRYSETRPIMRYILE